MIRKNKYLMYQKTYVPKKRSYKQKRTLKKGDCVHVGAGSAVYTVTSMAGATVKIKHSVSGKTFAVDKARVHHCT